MPPEDNSGKSTPRSFTSQSATAEDLLKTHTVGLVNLDDFRKRRAEAVEQKEREAHDRSLGRVTAGNSRSATPSGDVTDGNSTSRSEGPPKKKKKKLLAKSKLSFGDDEGDTEESAVTPREHSTPRSATRTPVDENGSRRITPNPNAPPPPRAMTKASIESEAQTRDALRKEFLIMQEAIKNTEILVPFIFYDGTNIPAGKVRIRKGDAIWLLLDRCRKVGAELNVGTKGRKDHRREWARIDVNDLMLVKGDIIVPHHYEFYYFIANKVPSFSRAGGFLFDYSNKPPAAPSTEDPLSRPSDEGLEGGDQDPTQTKVVDRRWYEKNKHIFPASLWQEYEPGKEFEEKMGTTRRDAQGNAFFF